MSACRPSVVRSISFDPLTCSIPNLVQELPSMSRWSLMIFMSHVQRSRSNHSFEPSVLSAQYLLTPSLDQYQTLFRGCPQWVDDPCWFSGHMLKGQCQTTLHSPLCYPLNIFWPLNWSIPNLVQGLHPCFVHISSNFEFCTKGVYIYVESSDQRSLSSCMIEELYFSVIIMKCPVQSSVAYTRSRTLGSNNLLCPLHNMFVSELYKHVPHLTNFWTIVEI